jgi:hypothetical protein
MGPSSLSSPSVQGAGAFGAEGSPGVASQKLGAGPGMSGRGLAGAQVRGQRSQPSEELSSEERAHNHSLPQSKKWRRQVREEASEGAPPNLDVASLTMRWESRAPEDSFFKRKRKPDFPPVGMNPTLATLYFRD